jgi:hypothetical protein
MRFNMRISSVRIIALCFLPAPFLSGQGTLADYQRAQELQMKAKGLVVNTPGAVTWIGDSEHFWYTRTVKDGSEFVLGDADAGSKKLAFDRHRAYLHRVRSSVRASAGWTWRRRPCRCRNCLRFRASHVCRRREIHPVRHRRLSLQMRIGRLHMCEGWPHPVRHRRWTRRT